jgi:hypothetical protein
MVDAGATGAIVVTSGENHEENHSCRVTDGHMPMEKFLLFDADMIYLDKGGVHLTC